MKSQSAREAGATTKPASHKLIKPESQLDKLKELRKAIRRRAHGLFESRGCEHGQDIADWLRAESDLLQPVSIRVSEYGDRLSVEAELPGFSSEEIEVSAEPRRLIISGRISLTGNEENIFSREVLAESAEILTKGAFHLLDLPVEIDADSAEANLTGETLTVILPKVAVDRMSHAQASAV